MAFLPVRAAAVLLFTALLLAVAACGSNEQGAPSASASPAASGTAAKVSPANGSSGAVAAKGPPWTASTQGGRFLVTIRPEHGAPRIGSLDPWLVQVTSPTGAPVQPIRLFFDGGMPQHRHGFESKPRVTDDLGGGLIRVDGVRFQMAGAWTIRVDVATAEGADFALFALEIGP